MLKRYNQNIVTGTLSGVSGTAVTGASLFLGNSSDKVAQDTLSAYLIITAATSSVTLTPSWQVSNDGSTFTTVKLNTTLGTAIAVATGAQNITTAIEAPRSVYGYQWARMLLTVGGATGQGTDLYSIGYSYKQPD